MRLYCPRDGNYAHFRRLFGASDRRCNGEQGARETECRGDPCVPAQHVHRAEDEVPVVDDLPTSGADKWDLHGARISNIHAHAREIRCQPHPAEGNAEVVGRPHQDDRRDHRRSALHDGAAADAEELPEYLEEQMAALMNRQVDPAHDGGVVLVEDHLPGEKGHDAKDEDTAGPLPADGPFVERLPECGDHGDVSTV